MHAERCLYTVQRQTHLSLCVFLTDPHVHVFAQNGSLHARRLEQHISSAITKFALHKHILHLLFAFRFLNYSTVVPGPYTGCNLQYTQYFLFCIFKIVFIYFCI